VEQTQLAPSYGGLNVAETKMPWQRLWSLVSLPLLAQRMPILSTKWRHKASIKERRMIINLLVAGVITLLALPISLVHAGTTVASTGIVEVSVETGVIPGPGPVATGAGYALVAHPNSSSGQGGTKDINNPFTSSGFLGPDMHNTTGEGNVVSSVSAIGGGNLFFTSTVVAKVNPGLAENLPVAFATSVTDPLILTPSLGNLQVDFVLGAGSSFQGLPEIPSIADNPSMTFGGRVAPGTIPDPANFSGSIPGAIDIYTVGIEQSNVTGLIGPTVTLGSSNSFFTVSLSDTPAIINDRVLNAFSGTAGSFNVPTDTFLFSATVTPSASLTSYTFGTLQAGSSPGVEVIPEPSALLLFGTGLAGIAVLTKRRFLTKG